MSKTLFDCRYIDPYRAGRQRVEFVEAVIGDSDGYIQLAVTDDDRSAHIAGRFYIPDVFYSIVQKIE